MPLRNILGSLCLLALSVAVPLVGCSSDDAPAPAPEAPKAGVSILVSAAVGGTVGDAAGTVILTIPPGALTQDTAITLATSAQVEGVLTPVYDFGPSGLTFLKPASLKIKVTPPQDRDVGVAANQGGAWAAIVGSTFDDASGMAVANVDRLTPFAVLATGGAKLKVPTTCNGALADFTGCGGDPKGTWTIAYSCLDKSTVGLFTACPTATATAQAIDTRTITVDATAFNYSAGTVTLKAEYFIPPECFAEGTTTCEAQSVDQVACQTESGVCVCRQSYADRGDATSVDYSATGNTLTFLSDPVVVGDYCVQDDLLFFKVTGKTQLFVLKRK